MLVKKYIVYGRAPAQGRKVNDLMRSLDFGEGVFINKAEQVDITFKNANNIGKAKDILKQSYESELGWIDVNVYAL